MMNKENNEIKHSFVGIDYGSKLAGTTVVAFACLDGSVTNNKQIIQFKTSEKKKDADKFLIKIVEELEPEFIFLDAPLSLPGVYTNPEKFDDYFYRKSDKILKGMSPMFLGGLTARAMRLKRQFENKGIKVIEIYPAIHAQRMKLKTYNYKKQLQYIPDVLAVLQHNLPLKFEIETIKSWHQVDALLAYYAGFRYMNGDAEAFGDEAEGQIWV
ncbi:MAG: hypothetical protein AB8G11_17310 [Saprospiraceae bacterium]